MLLCFWIASDLVLDHNGEKEEEEAFFSEYLNSDILLV